MIAESLVAYIKGHPCYTHPIFKHWAQVNPDKDVVAALFHQIRSFCDSTRPGHLFPEMLIKHGLAKESHLVTEITESEESHAPELAAMAGHVINNMSDKAVFDNVFDQETVENYLKEKSDIILGNLPGYDRHTGLLIQNVIARNTFEGRKKSDKQTVLKNLGVTLALEIISNRHLIPGEKHCLIDAGLYPISIEEKEMHYLAEHWGEAGAEAMHEQAAKDAINQAVSPENKEIMFEGAKEFLDSLCALWDTLDSALLCSGYAKNTKKACSSAEALAV